MLDRSPGRATTRVGAAMASLKARIESRALAPGARLPSVRAFAGSLAVSKSTVVEAYERLVAEGEVTARRGAGFFVAGPSRPLVLAQARAARAGRRLAAFASRRARRRSRRDAAGIRLAPESWMPEAGIQRALRDLARDRAFRKTHYDSAAGYEPLRRQLAVRLGERGVVASPNRSC